MISQLFFLIYDSNLNAITSHRTEQDVLKAGEKRTAKDDNLPQLAQLAQEFVAKVPKLEFSQGEGGPQC
jgi:hypothetical protein